MRFLVLVLLLASSIVHAEVDERTAGLVTELVTNELAKEERFEVLSSRDVRRALELEADKQTLGCDRGIL